MLSACLHGIYFLLASWVSRVPLRKLAHALMLLLLRWTRPGAGLRTAWDQRMIGLTVRSEGEDILAATAESKTILWRTIAHHL